MATYINTKSDFTLRINLPEGYNGDFKVAVTSTGEGSLIVRGSRINGELRGIEEKNGVYFLTIKHGWLKAGDVRADLFLWIDNDWKEGLQLMLPDDDKVVITERETNLEEAEASLEFVIPFVEGNYIEVDRELSKDSNNPVSNKAVTEALEERIRVHGKYEGELQMVSSGLSVNDQLLVLPPTFMYSADGSSEKVNDGSVQIVSGDFLVNVDADYNKALMIKGEPVATEKYVDDKVSGKLDLAEGGTVEGYTRFDGNVSFFGEEVNFNEAYVAIDDEKVATENWAYDRFLPVEISEKGQAYDGALQVNYGVLDSRGIDIRLAQKPQVKILGGKDNMRQIFVTHPLIPSDEAEIVVMVYRKRNGKRRHKFDYDNGTLNGNRSYKKGWCVLMGTTTSPITFPDTPLSYAYLLSEMKDRFVTSDGAHHRSSVRYGLAVRVPNPDFLEGANAYSYNQSTQMIKGRPRYFYSEVFEMRWAGVSDGLGLV